MTDERQRPTHLDLFSGIGGFSLAFEAEGFRTIGFSEIDPYACAVLKKHWPRVKNYGDIKNVTAEALADAVNNGFNQEEVHAAIARSNGSKNGIPIGIHPAKLSRTRSLCAVLTGGFPCQPFSVAGKRGGASDDRALWPEMLAVIERVRPAWIVGENVPGIINMELDRVLSDLESQGYATRTFVIPACAVDARHRRDRVWIVANSESSGRGQRSEINGGSRERAGTSRQRSGLTDSNQNVADANEPGSQRRNSAKLPERSREWITGSSNPFSGTPSIWPDESEWFPKSAVCRVANGIPNRTHRLKCLGNSIVPQVAQIFAKAIYQEIMTEPKL